MTERPRSSIKARAAWERCLVERPTTIAGCRLRYARKPIRMFELVESQRQLKVGPRKKEKDSLIDENMYKCVLGSRFGTSGVNKILLVSLVIR